MKNKRQTPVLRTGILAAAACLALASPALAQQAPTAPPGPPAPGASPPPAFEPAPGASPPPAFEPAPAPAADTPPPAGERPAPPAWLYLEPYDYKEGAAIPPGYVLAEKARRWPYVTGGAVFGGAYALSVAVGFAGVLLNRPAPEQWGPMFIPVFGPFIVIDTLDAGGSGGSDGQVATFAIMGIVQLLGAATLVSAMFLPPKKVLIPETPFGEVETARRRGPKIDLQLPRIDVARVPGPTGDQLGGSLVLQGQFDL